MGRAHHQKTRDKNKQKLPQVPKNLKTDVRDVEYSQELADHADLEAQSRSDAADQRVNSQKRKL